MASLQLSPEGSGNSTERQRSPWPRRGQEGGGAYFECRTCSRRFASFQALGGHRTGHTRHALTLQRRRRVPERGAEAAGDTGNLYGDRAHWCAVCGLEFPMGQALGGHMRRHRSEAAAARPAVYGAAVAGVEQPPEMFDLNSPPVEEKDGEGDQDVERAEPVPRLLNLLV